MDWISCQIALVELGKGKLVDASIYELLDKRISNFRYVGSTIETIESRRKRHIREGSLKVKAWINAIGAENLSIRCIATCDETQRKEVEQKYIDYYREQGFDLLNHMPAQDGPKVTKWVPENPEEIITRYLNLESAEGIAHEYGIASDTVKRFLIDHQIQLRTNAEAASLRSWVLDFRRYAIENPDELITRYINGESMASIAKSFGVSQKPVKEWFKEQGIIVRGDTKRWLTAFGETKPMKVWATDPRCVVSYKTLSSRLFYGWSIEDALTVLPRKRLTPDEVREIRNLADGGMQQNEIAKLFPVSSQQISEVVGHRSWPEII